MDNLILKANIINILSAYYCEPDAELFWDEKFQNTFLENARMFDQEIYDIACKIIHSINQSNQNELLQEYTKIFLGPFEVVAHPYASVYLDGYTLYGETTQNILHYYNKCGLLFDEDIKDLPDHIVVVLNFIHYLTNCEINGNKDFPDINWAEKRKEFLNLYVHNWLPQFTEKIINGTESDFYKNLAILTKKFFQIL